MTLSKNLENERERSLQYLRDNEEKSKRIMQYDKDYLNEESKVYLQKYNELQEIFEGQCNEYEDVIKAKYDQIDLLKEENNVSLYS